VGEGRNTTETKEEEKEEEKEKEEEEGQLLERTVGVNGSYPGWQTAGWSGVPMFVFHQLKMAEPQPLGEKLLPAKAWFYFISTFSDFAELDLIRLIWLDLP